MLVSFSKRQKQLWDGQETVESQCVCSSVALHSCDVSSCLCGRQGEMRSWRRPQCILRNFVWRCEDLSLALWASHSGIWREYARFMWRTGCFKKWSSRTNCTVAINDWICALTNNFQRFLEDVDQISDLWTSCVCVFCQQMVRLLSALNSVSQWSGSPGAAMASCASHTDTVRWVQFLHTFIPWTCEKYSRRNRHCHYNVIRRDRERIRKNERASWCEK